MARLEDYKYNPDTGQFFNKHGREVGSYTRKYGRLVHKGKQYYLAQLAFFLVNGVWPECQIDHIDGDCQNNKWDNLRLCSRKENMYNRGKYSNGKSKYKGVYYQGKSILSKLQCNNVAYYLGKFDTEELAAEAYNSKAKELFGEYARLNVIQGN